MSKKNENILGEIQIHNGKKGIIPLNDVFLTFTFKDKSNWETLRKMINIIYSAYIEHYPKTKIELIEGEIKVITQFPHYKKVDSTTPKREDVRIESPENIDHVEFQNWISLSDIIARSIEYFYFELTRGLDKRVQSIWLLNGSVKELLDGHIFANYTLTNEANNLSHPKIGNILYVDLPQLAQTDTRAGDLAAVLIGTTKTPKDPDVGRIFQRLESSFNNFKEETEVQDAMTRAESLLAEGRDEGEEKARAELLPLITEQETRIEELEALAAQIIHQS